MKKVNKSGLWGSSYALIVDMDQQFISTHKFKGWGEVFTLTSMISVSNFLWITLLTKCKLSQKILDFLNFMVTPHYK